MAELTVKNKLRFKTKKSYFGTWDKIANQCFGVGYQFLSRAFKGNLIRSAPPHELSVPFKPWIRTDNPRQNIG